jgi:hypothetical protein
MPSTMSGGSGAIMLKKLYGAALRMPDDDWLVTQATGRGVIVEPISL